MYETVTEAISHYNYELLPEYFFGKKSDGSDGILKDINILEGQLIKEAFVDKILYELRELICYLTVIDIIKICDQYGFVLPKEEEYGKRGEIENYYTMINDLNKILLKRLCELGFKADRNTKNKADIDPTLVTKSPFLRTVNKFERLLYGHCV